MIHTNILFGDEAYSDTWIIVTDDNDCDVQVTIEDLLEDIPGNIDDYVRVFFYGRYWWIHRSLHFPM
ncbi:hypothetical protein KBD33_03065 [Candidatus Gracilibacteria bacterium]|nr:hypothetical protein [Candidatus Gracilibacteria bacterium]